MELRGDELGLVVYNNPEARKVLSERQFIQKTMKFYVLYLVVMLHIGWSCARLAPIFTACSRTDPKFEKCVKDVVELVRPYVAAGNYGEGQPKAPPLEPITIDEPMSIDRGSFKVQLTNVTIKGSSGYEVRRIKVNVGEKIINASVKIPKMLVNGQYSLDMQILLLRIQGKGDFELALNNTLCNLKLSYNLKQGENGQELVEFNPIPVKLKFDTGRFYLQNLFNGDPALGKIGNDAINANPHVLLDEVKPAFEDALGKIFTQVANSAVSGASELDILPL